MDSRSISGFFYPDRQLDIQANGSLAGINVEIDFDDNLRLKRGDDTFSAQLSWRFRDKWSVIGQYFRSSGGRGVARRINVDGVVVNRF